MVQARDIGVAELLLPHFRSTDNHQCIVSLPFQVCEGMHVFSCQGICLSGHHLLCRLVLVFMVIP